MTDRPTASKRHAIRARTSGKRADSASGSAAGSFNSAENIYRKRELDPSNQLNAAQLKAIIDAALNGQPIDDMPDSYFQA